MPMRDFGTTLWRKRTMAEAALPRSSWNGEPEETIGNFIPPGNASPQLISLWEKKLNR